jgi:hypothetical protein
MNERLQKFIGDIDLGDILLLTAIVILSLNNTYGFAGWLLLFFYLKNINWG